MGSGTPDDMYTTGTDIARDGGQAGREEAWEAKLAALWSYRRATGHLAPRQDAVWGEGEAMVPIGQHMANLRRKGGLGKDAERAAVRA